MRYSNFAQAMKVADEILGEASFSVETGIDTIKISVSERGWPANIGMDNEEKLNSAGWSFLNYSDEWELEV